MLRRRHAAATAIHNPAATVTASHDDHDMAATTANNSSNSNAIDSNNRTTTTSISTTPRMVRRLLILRHCESLQNVQQDHPGVDVGLTAKGRAQGRALGRHPLLLQAAAAEKNGKGGLAVVCSPLRRCRQTLALARVAQWASSVVVEPLARERLEDNCDFLPGEDVSRLETAGVFTRRMERLKMWLWDHRPVDTVGQGEAGGDLLLVAHSEVAFVLTSQLVGGERFGQSLENGAVLETWLHSDMRVTLTPLPVDRTGGES